MTGTETAAAPVLPPHRCYMACHFSPEHRGLGGLPEDLPPQTPVILTDRFPCRNHDPRRIAAELAALDCGGVLLDFERKPQTEAIRLAEVLCEALPCPVAAPPGFIGDSGCDVFLPPCPLHVPLAAYLEPWRDRAVWLEIGLQTQTLTVTGQGTAYGPVLPAQQREGGYFDETLLCQCVTEISDTQACFTLFDTPRTLARKLEEAAALGVRRAVGLWQELAETELW